MGPRLVEKKTTLRTIRLEDELDRILEEDARGRGSSVNALVMSILTKHVRWDRYAEKFGLMSISRFTFRSLVESLDDDTRNSLAETVVTNVIKAALISWYGKIDLQTFLDACSLLSRYCGYLSLETKVEGPKYTLIFRHDLGEAYSKYLERMMRHAVRNLLGFAKVQTDIAGTSVIVTFESSSIQNPTRPIWEQGLSLSP